MFLSIEMLSKKITEKNLQSQDYFELKIWIF